jgi:hypothetical protein
MNSIRLRSPGDVVAVLPYQLGYHPDDSLVVVALRDRAVVLVERVDLPAPSDAEEASRVLLPPLLHEDPDAVLLVAYETREGLGRPALDALRGQLVGAGLDVLDRMVVRDGRWFAVDCVTGCCPVDGSPVPSAADTPAVAEFVGLGISPLPGRGALAALVAPDPERTPAVAAALEARAGRGRGLGEAAARLEALSAWAVFLGVRHAPDQATDGGSGGAPGERSGDGVGDGVGDGLGDGSGALPPDQVALLVDSLRDTALRDALIGWLCPGSLPVDCLSPEVVDAVRTCLATSGGDGQAWREQGRGGPGPRLGTVGRRGPRRAAPAVTLAGRHHLDRLQHLVRAVPDEHAAAPLTVLANLAWWLGDGALARTCVDRALAASPGYRLALLLERMLDLGVRPGTADTRTDDRWAG